MEFYLIALLTERDNKPKIKPLEKQKQEKLEDIVRRKILLLTLVTLDYIYTLYLVDTCWSCIRQQSWSFHERFDFLFCSHIFSLCCFAKQKVLRHVAVARFGSMSASFTVTKLIIKLHRLRNPLMIVYSLTKGEKTSTESEITPSPSGI